ncbi:hypothetical protein [Actinophytocola sp.]|uniref:hypothetical protein n=1 Tax=Actinophytocola sp. TaxID=1872138 RepID=UPI002ED381AE
MAGRSWAVVITAAASALVAAGALIASAMLRDSGVTTAETTVSTTATTPGVGMDGCLGEKCTVLATLPVGDTMVELVAEADGTAGRLRIGGAGSSEVIELTVTKLGAALTTESLRCVADSLSACLVGGPYSQGYAAEVVVGRSAQWSEITEPFLSDAGFVTLANVTADPGAEVLTAQHRCDPQVTADCATTPVFVRVHNLRHQELGCTRTYARLDALPGWPTVTLRSTDLKPCA